MYINDVKVLGVALIILGLVIAVQRIPIMSRISDNQSSGILLIIMGLVTIAIGRYIPEGEEQRSSISIKN